MLFATLTLAIGLASCASPDTVPVKSDTTITMSDTTKKMPTTDAEWKAQLTNNQYHILREKGTERAFTGEYWNNHEQGYYECAGCHSKLFKSEEKFDSGCGWPSFSLPWDSTAVNYHDDNSYGMKRTEVTCRTCGGHLGHVFDDGPPPTNLRYCINSGAMVFVKQD